MRRRLVGAAELAICAALIAVVAVYALWKMDYLSADTAYQIRMGDSARSAYVAKNLVDGNGYTTNDMPSWLIAFYDQGGKLHADHWPNADRFPFTAFAVAALYTITGTTSDEVGILVYNLLCFVGLFVAIYWLTREIWDDRYAALFALGIALLHPYTYVFLYVKDADTLLLTTGVLACLHRYYARPPDELSRRVAVTFGTVLGWLMLARPNEGAVFGLYFALVAVRRAWLLRRDVGWPAALRRVALCEGIALAVAFVWLVPFIIYSLSTWGSPFFSANAMYQLPLGTRFAMGTDTWWKYSEPGHQLTVASLIHDSPGVVLSKFTTSWVATLKDIVRGWSIELLLACGLLAWMSRRTTEPGAPGSTIGRLAIATGFVVLVNLLVLPLYGYQDCTFRHYLSFFMPLLWIVGGRTISVIVDQIRPQVATAFDRIRSRPGMWIAIVVAALMIWNLGSKDPDASELFASTAKVIATHWITGAILLSVLLWHRWLFRPPVLPRVIGLVTLLAIARFQPRSDLKLQNLAWFPADKRVWDVLRERKGIVASLAAQSEVAWISGRKNVPAPELPMHIYSFLYDHQLEIEDVYLESAENMVSTTGSFHEAAPGFEGYARLQKYGGRFPGYAMVFHDSSTRSYPKYKVKPMKKGSTIYRLVDRDAVQAMRRSPDRIELGDPANVIYTAHGFGEYLAIDGKPLVTATDATRKRYTTTADRPWEDSSITFFLDDRRPKAVDLEIYAPLTGSLQLYWNLDLFAYDPSSARARHLVATYDIATTGWQHIRFTVPAGVTRSGLNKLGFRSAHLPLVTACPPSASDAACAAMKPPAEPTEEPPEPGSAVTVVRADIHEPTPMRASVFVGAIQLEYP